MCGIVGYVGKRNCSPIVLSGLEALEYRGYDSAGIAISYDHSVACFKQSGNVKKLRQMLEVFPDREMTGGKSGIGHTRWATHGEPNQVNAHPHTDCTNRVYLVHNGIIENYKELRSYLESNGHKFASETDTEIIAHMIEDFLRSCEDFKTAFAAALKMVVGTYALAVLDARDNERIYAARQSSPLVVGVGKDENFVASDPSAIIASTKKVIYLKDGEIAEVTASRVLITDMDMHPTPVAVEHLEWDLEQAQKGNFPHFMLKEIFEGPEVVRSAMRGRLIKTAADPVHHEEINGLHLVGDSDGMHASHAVKLGGLESVSDRLTDIERLIILACGTSYYAGLVAEYIFEEIARIPTEVHLASEFRYRNEPIVAGSVVLAISQSGETADTLGALRKAKDAGLLTLGIVNVVGSTIARETDAGIFNHAGPEMGVASTKAFLSQLTTLTLLAIYLAKSRNGVHGELMEELLRIPAKIEGILKNHEHIRRIAEKYAKAENFLFLGRRYNYPVALEGALKLKEVSYIHAEGYGAGEMKHGPIAMISPSFPTVAVMPHNGVSDKMYSNIEEIKARKGPVIAIATEGDIQATILADDIFFIPPTIEALEPLLAVVPLQLFAYYMGTGRGYDVDRPRNLAKSVTVE